MKSTPWLKCAVCGVTQPCTSLDYAILPKVWHCRDQKRCAENKLHVEREQAEFRLRHPDLHPAGAR